ncbi:helix-turn-helix domain-containing protein [Streptacidiphilus cavernicola]|uniref:Helix-turn-helix domain-containing protein n=1 Tax=Streptacidiphilus cavernicola TaxID=3342716 RepID=A0ABV6VYE1_9ACTN
MGAPARKLVLVLLCEKVGEDFLCWPSVRTLALHAELSGRQVQNHLRWLREAGLIRTEQRLRPNGSKSTNTYYILTPERLEMDHAGAAGAQVCAEHHADRCT